MLAIIAAFCFLWGMFSDHLGPIPAIPAGLLFIALHMCLGIGLPWRKSG